MAGNLGSLELHILLLNIELSYYPQRTRGVFGQPLIREIAVDTRMSEQEEGNRQEAQPQV